MHHIQYCLDEILAEIDARLERHGLIRALTQLDQRAAAKDPVTAIDAGGLRDHIVRQIADLPLSQVRSRIMEAKDLVTAVLDEPLPPRSNVIVLTAEAGGSGLDDVAKTLELVGAAPATRPAPQFKTMRERLAAAVGDGNEWRAHPRRA